jgi:hypothetical protein
MNNMQRALNKTPIFLAAFSALAIGCGDRPSSTSHNRARSMSNSAEPTVLDAKPSRVPARKSVDPWRDDKVIHVSRVLVDRKRRQLLMEEIVSPDSSNVLRVGMLDVDFDLAKLYRRSKTRLVYRRLTDGGISKIVETYKAPRFLLQDVWDGLYTMIDAARRDVQVRQGGKLVSRYSAGPKQQVYCAQLVPGHSALVIS